MRPWGSRALWLREVSDAFRLSMDTPVRTRFRPIVFNMINIAPFYSYCVIKYEVESVRV